MIGALSDDSDRRAAFVESQVKSKFEKMLHPPLTYLGDAFQYRAADGKFNSAMNPHLGQAGAPYAKTVRLFFAMVNYVQCLGILSLTTFRDRTFLDAPFYQVSRSVELTRISRFQA